jgi:translation initiation factor 2 beta subunit (eIF-2beta)/eIF-5
MQKCRCDETSLTNALNCNQKSMGSWERQTNLILQQCNDRSEGNNYLEHYINISNMINHLNSSNMIKTTTFAFGSPGTDLEQAQGCDWAKEVNEI